LHAGISESAHVAFVIFIIHLSTMTILIIGVISRIGIDGFPISEYQNDSSDSSRDDNDNTYTDKLTVLQHNAISILQPSLLSSLVFGFSSAMLGVTGFETSANFVEEQKDGVFIKTLRNMWILVTLLNPLICTLAISVLELEHIQQNNTSVLAHMAYYASGYWLEQLVAADAFLVLSGSVLTSFIGMSMKNQSITELIYLSRHSHAICLYR
jgi:amino acid transporter